MAGQHQHGQLANDETEKIRTAVTQEYMPVRIIPNQESNNGAQGAQCNDQQEPVAQIKRNIGEACQNHG
ncbi:hypothetical protein D3C72_2140570 [compost metagenome]